MKRIALLLTLLSVLLLASCGGNGDSVTPQADSVQKMGFAEGELFDAANNPTGHVLAAGETGILMLEAVGTSSQSGDTGTAGTDEIWLETKTGGPAQLSLDEEGLKIIESAELLDSSRNTVLHIDSTNTSAGKDYFSPGKYILKVVSKHTLTDPVPLFVTLPAEDSQATAKTSVKSVSYIAGTSGQLLQTNICVGCNLSRVDLGSANLSHANISYSNLDFADLSYANLSYANLSHSYLPDAYLYNANLTYANLSYTNLDHADLSDADLSDANLSYSNLSFADLYDAHMSGANLSYVYLTYAHMYGANLNCAILSNAVLSGADLKGADLSYANLSNAWLFNANLINANLTGADLSFANLTGTLRYMTDLTGAITTGTKWK
jgi:uncharacterized protein YjbI with pentapeptide repeats